MKLSRFDQLIQRLRSLAAGLPDRRTGSNIQYSMADIALSAFSVFFTQCPSFLAYQKAMQQNRGRSNAQSLFEIERIPTDNHIRHTLDPIEPHHLFELFDDIYEAYEEHGILDSMRALHQTQLIALDGTWYFSSQSENIHCPNCSSRSHANGKTTHYHSALTPVIVSPGHSQVVPLRPEFITPQDGHRKQDCEIVAAKRWLEKHGGFYAGANATLLGDDLFAHEPFCRRALLYGFHFLFTCKPASHTHLSAWIEQLEPGPELQSLSLRVKNKTNRWENHHYRWVNGVPLTDSDDALKVNWVEVTLTDKDANILYRNAFITDFKIGPGNVQALVASARARWKIENENNNTLKTKGYHLEHNFGHGKKHLSSLLLTLNLLAFLFHGFLSLCDENYRLIRAVLPTRRTFFEHIRALTHYICFDSWEHLTDFMMEGLEIGPYAPRS